MKIVVQVGRTTLVDLARFDFLSLIEAPEPGMSILYATEVRDDGSLFDHAIAIFDSTEKAKDAIEDVAGHLQEKKLACFLAGAMPATQEHLVRAGMVGPAAGGQEVQAKMIVARFTVGASSLEEARELIGRKIVKVEQAGAEIAVVTEGPRR